MDFKQYWRSLDNQQRLRFAKQSATTYWYINHILVYGARIPHAERIKRFAFLSGIPEKKLRDWFYEENERYRQYRSLKRKAA